MPFYLGNVLGLDTGHIGLMLTVVPIALGVTAPLSGWLSDRFGTRPITVIGLAVLVVAYVCISSLSTDTSMLGFVLLTLPLGLGMGIFQSPNNSAIMGSAPRERLGVASGLLSLTRTLGQVTGTAVLGALWAANVIQRAGTPLPGGATTAAPSFQVGALHDTFTGMVVLVVFGLALAVWALAQERRRGLAPVIVPREEIVDLVE
jgi:MFS family permease